MFIEELLYRLLLHCYPFRAIWQFEATLFYFACCSKCPASLSFQLKLKVIFSRFTSGQVFITTSARPRMTCIMISKRDDCISNCWSCQIIYFHFLMLHVLPHITDAFNESYKKGCHKEFCLRQRYGCLKMFIKILTLQGKYLKFCQIVFICVLGNTIERYVICY